MHPNDTEVRMIATAAYCQQECAKFPADTLHGRLQRQVKAADICEAVRMDLAPQTPLISAMVSGEDGKLKTLYSIGAVYGEGPNGPRIGAAIFSHTQGVPAYPVKGWLASPTFDQASKYLGTRLAETCAEGIVECRDRHTQIALDARTAELQQEREAAATSAEILGPTEVEAGAFYQDLRGRAVKAFRLEGKSVGQGNHRLGYVTVSPWRSGKASVSVNSSNAGAVVIAKDVGFDDAIMTGLLVHEEIEVRGSKPQTAAQLELAKSTAEVVAERRYPLKNARGELLGVPTPKAIDAVALPLPAQELAEPAAAREQQR